MARHVRVGRFQNEDTGETVSVYLYSHEDIDAEINRRLWVDAQAGRNRAHEHEATRTKFHVALESAG